MQGTSPWSVVPAALGKKKDPNEALQEQRAPHMHHGSSSSLTAASSMPSVPSRAAPEGQSAETWQLPWPQGQDRATSSSQGEAPGATLFSDTGER